MRTYILKLAGMLSVVALLAMPNMASAAGTQSGTLIGNTATLTFSVGGTTQPTVQGIAPSFTVDRKIDVNVALQTVSPLNVLVPNSTNNVHAFRVTNLGNGPAVGADPYGNFTFPAVTAGGAVLAAVDLYADTNNSGTLNAGDTLLAPTTVVNIPADQYTTVFMVGTATNAATLAAANGTTETYNLVAVAATAAGAALSPSAAPTAGEDIVFTDGAGTAAGDTANNGQHSASGSFTAATAIIGMTKDVYSITDPYSGAALGYAIPGATVTYRMIVTNTGTASATLASIGDPLNANLTYVPGSANWSLTDGVNTDAAIGGATLAAGTLTFDIGGVGTGFLTLANTPNTSAGARALGELKAGETLTLKFQATIN